MGLVMEKKKVRVLLIEDNPGDARLVEEILNEAPMDGLIDFQIELRWFNLLQTGLGYLANGVYDLVLLDLDLPDGKGLDSVDEIYKVTTQIPIIILSGIEDDISIEEAVNRGACEYISKNELKGDRLIKSIVNALRK